MYRATTPTHTYTLPEDTSSYSEIQVTYKQGSRTIVKHYKDGVTPSGMTLSGNNVIIVLTQQETAQFDKGPASSHVRVLTTGGKVYASNKFNLQVQETNNEEILS